MRVKSARFINFKRFTDLRIQEIPATAQLVVITGPNGSGKSAIFEGFNWRRRASGGWGAPHDPSYFPKSDREGQTSRSPEVQITFHEGQPNDRTTHRKSFWIRSAYRHEADFNTNQLRRQTPALEDAGLDKLIQVEQTVRKNYERLASQVLQGVFDRTNDTKPVGELREEYIGRIRRMMSRVFGGLTLQSPGDPIEDGTFFFDKGASARIDYKNLSGGEKAAFDLILDFLLRLDAYDNTVFCIDEPELHLGSRVQARLLEHLYEEVPVNCQLWIATHSLGMMRQAFKIHQAHPGKVAFLDTSNSDFDLPTTITPVSPNRKFWRQVLEVALDDMADLIAPSRVVLCEGTDPAVGFDAAIYRTIFAEEFPDVEFLSVGNSNEVKRDRAGVASAIEVIAPGTQIYRLIDRDDHSDEEVTKLRMRNVRVLRRRNLECYLLDDEILSKLCMESGQPHKTGEAISVRDAAVKDAAVRGRASDDFKSARGAVQVFAQKQLGLRQSGSNADEFLRATVAPLVLDTQVYVELRDAIFT